MYKACQAAITDGVLSTISIRYIYTLYMYIYSYITYVDFVYCTNMYDFHNK